MRTDRGQLVPVFGGVLVVGFVLALFVVRLGVAANDRAHAQAVADVTALAAAGGGEAAATRVAEANGGRLEAITIVGSDATVTVEVRGLSATASARREGSGSGPVAGTAGLHPDLVAAVAEAERLLGRPLTITSGLRSRAEQEALWADRHRNPYPVARPGTSKHERGLAVDVVSADVEPLRAVADRVGLCQPLPVSDPIHFELCGR